MKQIDTEKVRRALEECVAHYIDERRERLPAFVRDHYSLGQTLEEQKKTWLADVIRYPLNTLWAIPYLMVKKGSETLEKVGFNRFSPFVSKIPSNIKTQYQAVMEKRVCTDLLEWPHALLYEIKHHPDLRDVHQWDPDWFESLVKRTNFEKEMDSVFASRALMSDLSGSVATAVLGWALFGERTLASSELGQKIAAKMAHDEASSNFLLGPKLGSAFYDVFPPEPTFGQTMLGVGLVCALVTIVSITVGALSDPIAKQLKLHDKRLKDLVDTLEKGLLLQIAYETRRAPWNDQKTEKKSKRVA